MTSLTRVQTADDTLNRIQSNVQKAIQDMQSIFTSGRLIQSVALKSGQDNVINHGLGKQPKVWIICDLSDASAPALTMNSYTPAGTISGTTFTGTPATLTGSISSPVVWRTAWDTNSLTLRSGANCTVSLWVA